VGYVTSTIKVCLHNTTSANLGLLATCLSSPTECCMLPRRVPWIVWPSYTPAPLRCPLKRTPMAAEVRALSVKMLRQGARGRVRKLVMGTPAVWWALEELGDTALGSALVEHGHGPVPDAGLGLVRHPVLVLSGIRSWSCPASSLGLVRHPVLVLSGIRSWSCPASGLGLVRHPVLVLSGIRSWSCPASSLPEPWEAAGGGSGGTPQLGYLAS